MSELIIREMDSGEEFADWFADLTQREQEETGEPSYLEDHYLILSNEIGDWIGGLRYALRGGIAQVLDIAIRQEERHLGHGHRLLEAFELRAQESGAHLAEFWTDDLRGEPELLAHGWLRVVRRDGYIGGRTWYLMEKSFPAV
ncbi:MAG TPA: GNAT family N-acetyltransferase [Gemmatimonadales bacterium]|nr:GNAT family N-acetyltransferase [Gemmatimonadales bacterium]